MLCYLFHRYQTIKLFVKSFNIENLFIALSVLVAIGMGMVDPTYFYPQFALTYSFMLCFAEKQENGTSLKNLLKKEG